MKGTLFANLGNGELLRIGRVVPHMGPTERRALEDALVTWRLTCNERYDAQLPVGWYLKAAARHEQVAYS